MEIRKAPTLRLKVLNKHSVAYNVHRDGNVVSIKNVYKKKRKKLIHNVDKGSSVTMQKMHTHTHTHTHTHARTRARARTVQTCRGDGQCC